MQQAAFSVWDGRIAPVFDTARVMVVLRFREGAFAEERRITLPASSAMGVLDFLRQTGSRCLICGAISRPLQEELRAGGIQVVAFVSGDLLEVARAWVAKRLDQPAFRMPGCGCGRRRGGHGASCQKSSVDATKQKDNCRRWGGRNKSS